MREYALRIARTLLGLCLYAIGMYMGIQANVGFGAWESFHLGIAGWMGLSYGDVAVLTGLVILVADVALREKIGIGTVLNTFLIGKLVDLLNLLDILPQMHSFWPGVGVLLLGQVVVCLGIYFYVGAGLGAGPRDSLMVALGKRMPRVPIGLVRGVIEGTVLLAGWLLGAKVGIGTVISVFGISFIMQATFRVLRFDVKAVRHENLLETWRRLARRGQCA